MQDFRSLRVWEKAHALVMRVFPMSRRLPKDELFGLQLTLRRVSAAIPMKIAEGCGRNNDPDFHKCLNAAMGNAADLEYQLILVRDLGYLPNDEYAALNAELVEVKKMLNVFLQRLS